MWYPFPFLLVLARTIQSNCRRGNFCRVGSIPQIDALSTRQRCIQERSRSFCIETFRMRTRKRLTNCSTQRHMIKTREEIYTQFQFLIVRLLYIIVRYNFLWPFWYDRQCCVCEGMIESMVNATETEWKDWTWGGSLQWIGYWMNGPEVKMCNDLVARLRWYFC